ncbi:MAG: hypothetical protein IPM26_16930 [Saprospiraceae bacterium]|nr:hypothetical protein [Saprospiraceae bacterium]
MIHLQRISFENIDKNKWNGLVHYAPDSSVYAYHWYLKAVAGSFDVLIEGDYESGLPVFRQSLSTFQKKLIPETGIHTINLMSPSRIKSFIENPDFDNIRFWQAFKNTQTTSIQSLKPGLPSKKYTILSLTDAYESLREGYSSRFSAMLEDITSENIQITLNPRPEELLKTSALKDSEKNILYRLMYNAMHRGILFSSMLGKAHNSDIAKAVFFYNPGTITEIWSESAGNPALMAVLYDYVFRTHCGRKMTMRFSPFSPSNIIQELPVISKDILYVEQRSWWEKLLSKVQY